jgi:hypothetical protein
VHCPVQKPSSVPVLHKPVCAAVVPVIWTIRLSSTSWSPQDRNKQELAGLEQHLEFCRAVLDVTFIKPRS